MGGPTFNVRTRKFKENPLLGRKQFVVDVIHPGSANVSKADVAEKLASMYKVKDPKTIVTFGFHTAFGGGSSSGMGLIYESLDKVKKFEPNFRLKRAGLYTGMEKSHGGIGRRNFKKMKTDVLKSRSSKKRDAISNAGSASFKKKHGKKNL